MSTAPTTGKGQKGHSNWDPSDIRILDQIDKLQILPKYMNCTLEFKDCEMREKFFIFKVATGSPYLLCCYAAIQTMLFYWYSSLSTDFSSLDWICTISCLSALLSLWGLVLIRLALPLKQQVKSFRKTMTIMEQAISLGSVVLHGLIFALHCYGHCGPQSQISCSNNEQPFINRGTTLYLLAIFCLSPLIYLTTFSFVSYRFIIFIQLLKFLVLGFLFRRLIEFVPICWLTVIVLLTTICMIMYCLQKIIFFIGFRKIDEEQRIFATQKAANDVCSMISHDFKTPMTAFLVGFEELANSLSETSKLVDLMSLHNLVSSKATLQEKIYHCKSTVSLLFGSYHFFLSAVNRATDFTRCFHKISLIPKIAPINLTESLISAISVIKQVQGKICIELNIVHRENMSEYILTDGDWFKDNLLCLLENAIRWSDVQFAAVYVKKFLMNEQPFLRIEVEDSGPGFPFDHKTTNDVSVVDQTILNNIKKKIEDPNYSNRVDLGGLGLGLYCLSQRVYALHGDYGIKRRKKGQRGSIVWFSFPYKDYRPTKELLSVTKANKKLLMYTPNDPANIKEEHYDYDGEHNAEEIRKMDNTGTIHYEESEESEESGGTTEYSNLLPDIPTIIQPKKILIAEDSIPVAKLISSSLIRRGFETVLVANGLEAVEAVRDKSLSSEMISSISDGESEGIPYFLEHFDAILMDLQMPVMTGLEAICKIRELQKKQGGSGKSYFIVAVSAGKNPEEINAAYECGANHFLSKPFELKTFVKLVQDNIDSF